MQLSIELLGDDTPHLLSCVERYLAKPYHGPVIARAESVWPVIWSGCMFVFSPYVRYLRSSIPCAPVMECERGGICIAGMNGVGVYKT